MKIGALCCDVCHKQEATFFDWQGDEVFPIGWIATLQTLAIAEYTVGSATFEDRYFCSKEHLIEWMSKDRKEEN